ncbi:M23 family metallopeptidase [Kamptonema cortianum]|nr:M23 family metallopeptidase [Kamptonema cortianum]
MALLISLMSHAADNAGGRIQLVLPTPNDAIDHGGGPAFYMHTDRDFEGQKTKPWEGGTYGYVRTLKRTPYGIIATRFHEGIDIRPVKRDATGEPLDPILSIDDGKVVHINHVSRHSNYGLYVVVTHQWQGCEYYSLYAHLAEIDVRPGQMVRRGERLGRLGYTGAGINRERAHLHFETGVIINRHFQRWFDQAMPGEINRQGMWNGINLYSWNPALFLLEYRTNPTKSLPEFIRKIEGVSWKALVPNPGRIDLLERYPWLREGYRGNPVSWEIHFGETGIPVRFLPRGERVEEPRLLWVKQQKLPLQYQSKGMLTGTSSNPSLTRGGYNYIRLILEQ